jgi:hypothetical protein
MVFARSTSFSRISADSAVYAGRIRNHVCQRRVAFLVVSDALLWQPFFLDQDEPVAARRRKYWRIPFHDRPPANGMGRGAYPALPGPHGRSGFHRSMGGDHISGPHDGLFLIGD